MELARSPTIFIQKYLSFLLFTRARAYLKKYICVKSFFFSKKSQNIWSYQKKAVPLRSLLNREQIQTVAVYLAQVAGKDG